MRRFILLSFLAFPAFAVDEQPPKLEAVPEAPKPPMPVQSGETLEPDITIIRKGKKTIQEYRRGGRLYMIKVIPDVGPPTISLITMATAKWMSSVMKLIKAATSICGKYWNGSSLIGVCLYSNNPLATRSIL